METRAPQPVSCYCSVTVGEESFVAQFVYALPKGQMIRGYQPMAVAGLADANSAHLNVSSRPRKEQEGAWPAAPLR